MKSHHPSLPRIIYVCAPRTGILEENIPAIQGCAAQLRSFGFQVISPVDVNMVGLGVSYSPPIGPDTPLTIPGLRLDVFALLSCCTCIALMPGWESARGCRLEVAIGITFGFTFVDWQTGRDVPRPMSVTIDHGYGERDPMEWIAQDSPARVMGI